MLPPCILFHSEIVLIILRGQGEEYMLATNVFTATTLGCSEDKDARPAALLDEGMCQRSAFNVGVEIWLQTYLAY
jgi:hypothetical protein